MTENISEILHSFLNESNPLRTIFSNVLDDLKTDSTPEDFVINIEKNWGKEGFIKLNHKMVTRTRKKFSNTSDFNQEWFMREVCLDIQVIPAASILHIGFSFNYYNEESLEVWFMIHSQARFVYMLSQKHIHLLDNDDCRLLRWTAESLELIEQLDD